MIKKIINNLQKKKVKGVELVNLLANLGEDYFEIDKKFEEEHRKNLMGAVYYGKTNITPTEKGLEINLDLYTKATYRAYDSARGLTIYPTKKYKIKSLNGLIKYPKLRLQ
jgi:hypothetical protein